MESVSRKNKKSLSKRCRRLMKSEIKIFKSALSSKSVTLIEKMQSRPQKVDLYQKRNHDLDKKHTRHLRKNLKTPHTPTPTHSTPLHILKIKD